jgi:hypothetical protein
MRRTFSLFVVLVSCLIAAPASAGNIDPFNYVATAKGWCKIPRVTERLGDDNRDGDLSLYLFANGNFAIAYEEHTPSCAGVPGECRHDVPVVFFVEGRLSEAGNTVTFPGFGSATIEGSALKIVVSDPRASATARAHVFTARVVGTSAVAYSLARQMEYRGYRSTIPEVRDAQY